MSDYHSRPDGEYHVDQVEKPIPAESTWGEMSFSQLIDVKNQLEEKLWQFRNNAQIGTVLKRSVLKITELIAIAVKS